MKASVPYLILFSWVYLVYSRGNSGIKALGIFKFKYFQKASLWLTLQSARDESEHPFSWPTCSLSCDTHAPFVHMACPPTSIFPPQLTVWFFLYLPNCSPSQTPSLGPSVPLSSGLTSWCWGQTLTREGWDRSVVVSSSEFPPTTQGQILNYNLFFFFSFLLHTSHLDLHIH